MATVLITGAGRGIGFQLTHEFLARGHRVIATIRNAIGRDNLLSLNEKFGDKLDIFELEVTNADSINTLKRQLETRAVDILINNAGVLGGENQEVSNIDFTEWALTHEINTIAPLRVALALLPNIVLSKEPKIVTISSIMGALSWEAIGSIAYRSSKAALNKAMQCLALELKSKNIGVYLMHPGWVQTDMGGAEADISVEESAKKLTTTILQFTLADTAKFWQYDGQPLDW